MHEHAAPPALAGDQAGPLEDREVVRRGAGDGETDLQIVGRAQSLTSGAGRDAVYEFAEAADIAIVT